MTMITKEHIATMRKDFSNPTAEHADVQLVLDELERLQQELVMETKRCEQLSMNAKWLRGQIDRIHNTLCSGQNGTWQQRAEQAVEAAEKKGHQ